MAVAFTWLVALSASAQTTALVYSFSGSQSGIEPFGDLVTSSKSGYGTTIAGGTEGYGTVYKMNAKGREAAVHSFQGGTTDGASPSGNLAQDKAGNLYGTTQSGGSCTEGDGTCGTVFTIDATGRESVLYSFQPGTGDAQNPASGVTLDSSGNLYGVAQGGKYGQGAVFKVNSSTGEESVFYSFGTNAQDGEIPIGAVVFDAKGNLYGTALFGGACISGGGTVFKITPNGVESTLRSFCVGDTNGATPSGPVAVDAAGDIYGVTQQGGDLNCPNSFALNIGCGTVFKITASGQYSVIHAFAGGTADGAGDPGIGSSGLGVILDSAGNLYGITQFGGATSGLGNGTVFEVAKGTNYKVLHVFQGGTGDGSQPQSILLYLSGNLYGTTFAGGASNYGTIFRTILK